MVFKIFNLLSVAVSKSKDFYEENMQFSVVSSKRELKKSLENLGIDTNNLNCFITKKKIRNLDEIEGIFQKNGEVYVYTSSKNSDLIASKESLC